MEVENANDMSYEQGIYICKCMEIQNIPEICRSIEYDAIINIWKYLENQFMQ